MLIKLLEIKYYAAHEKDFALVKHMLAALSSFCFISLFHRSGWKADTGSPGPFLRLLQFYHLLTSSSPYFIAALLILLSNLIVHPTYLILCSL